MKKDRMEGSIESKIVYFEDIKPENTDITFKLVKERIGTLKIKKLVLVSTTGATAKKRPVQRI